MEQLPRMYVCRDAMDGNKRRILKTPGLLQQTGVFLNIIYFENVSICFQNIFKVCNIKVK